MYLKRRAVEKVLRKWLQYSRMWKYLPFQCFCWYYVNNGTRPTRNTEAQNFPTSEIKQYTVKASSLRIIITILALEIAVPKHFGFCRRVGDVIESESQKCLRLEGTPGVPLVHLPAQPEVQENCQNSNNIL